MTNEEIKKRVEELQGFIKASYILGTNFELNSDLYNYKQEICRLQKECTHVNSNFEKAVEDGYCSYCHRKMEE